MCLFHMSHPPHFFSYLFFFVFTTWPSVFKDILVGQEEEEEQSHGGGGGYLFAIFYVVIIPRQHKIDAH